MGKTRDLKKIRNTKGTFHAKDSESEFAQSCPTVCDPMDCSPPGSSIHGILQARILEGLPCPPSGDLPNQGKGLRSPAIQVDSLLSEPPVENKSSEAESAQK